MGWEVIAPGLGTRDWGLGKPGRRFSIPLLKFYPDPASPEPRAPSPDERQNFLVHSFGQRSMTTFLSV
jgi:hypothetical protein